MTILKRFLNGPSQEIPNWITILFLLFSFAGFVDATYLTIAHFANVIVPCSLTSGCETVLTSSYSEIFGIPIALFGALYYLTVFALALLYLDTKKAWAIRLLVMLSGMGFVISLLLLHIQVFVIHSICVYCVGSAISSTLLFGTGLFAFKKLKIKEHSA